MFGLCNSWESRAPAREPPSAADVEREVARVISRVLEGPLACRYREEENARQARKVSAGLHKMLRAAG